MTHSARKDAAERIARQIPGHSWRAINANSRAPAWVTAAGSGDGTRFTPQAKIWRSGNFIYGRTLADEGCRKFHSVRAAMEYYDSEWRLTQLLTRRAAATAGENGSAGEPATQPPALP